MFVCLNLKMCIKCVAVSLHVCSFMRFCIRNVRISSTLSGCASQVKDLPPPKKKTPWNFLGWKISTPRCSWWVREKSVTVSPPFCMDHTMVHVFFIEGPADPAQALTGLAEATVVPLFFQQAWPAPLSTSSLGPRLCCLGMDWRWLNDSWSKRKMQ